MNLKPAIRAALQRAQPSTVTCRMEARGNSVVRLVNGRVVATYKRRPHETTEQAFNRVVGGFVESGDIREITASSRDDVVLEEGELRD